MSVWNFLAGNSQTSATPVLDDPARKARFANAIQTAQTRTGPQDHVRTQQVALNNAVMGTATGAAPMASDIAAKAATDRAIATQNAMAASGRGVNPALAARIAAQQGAQASQAIAQGAAQMRIQEQQQAQQIAGQNLAQTRSQDLVAQQQIDELAAKYEAMGLAADQAQLQARTEIEKQNAAVRAQNAQNNRGLLGDIVGGIGSVVGFLSDKRLKTDIKSADKKVYKFLDALGAHEYSYKDPKHGAGKKVGPMAQELEKSEIGKAMVSETPEGKAVSIDGQSFAKVLAAQAHLHQRLKEIEGRKGKK